MSESPSLSRSESGSLPEEKHQKKVIKPQKAKKKNVKFTEFSFIIPSQKYYDAVLKDNRFQKLITKKLNTQSKKAEVKEEELEEGEIYCHVQLPGGRSFYLSELLKFQRTFPKMDITGPQKLIEMIDEKDDSREQKVELEVLPFKKRKLDCEINSQREKLRLIKQEHEEILSKTIELGKKVLELIKEHMLYEKKLVELQEKEQSNLKLEKWLAAEKERLDWKEAELVEKERKVDENATTNAKIATILKNKITSQKDN